MTFKKFLWKNVMELGLKASKKFRAIKADLRSALIPVNCSVLKNQKI